MRTADPTLDAYPIGGTVGFLVLEDADHIICAKGNQLVRLALQDGSVTLLTNFEIPDFLRFNDGKCDKDGRIWAGVMPIAENDPALAGSGALLCIEAGDITASFGGMTIPNGMDWHDGLFYHLDTPTKQICAYRQQENELTEAQVVVDLREQTGGPDGFCMDANGHIWVAMWGGHCVLCCDPKRGTVIDKIAVPDACVTCCTFGGENLRTLFITTATAPDGTGGHLYAVEMPVETTGRTPYHVCFGAR